MVGNFSNPVNTTGSSMLGGLMQGMQQKRQNETMDKQNELRDIQIEEMKAEIKRNNQDRSDLKGNEAVFELQQYGNRGPLESWLKTDAKYNGGGTIRDVQQSDYLNEDGTLRKDAINNYKQDTGFDVQFGSNEDIAKQLKSGSILTADDGTQKRLNPDTYEAGNLKYRTYKRDRIMKEKLQQAKLLKDLGLNSGKSPSDKAKAIDTHEKISKIPEAERTPTEKVQYKVASEQLGLTKVNAQDKLTGPAFTKMTDNFSADSWNPEALKGYDDDMATSMANAQMKSGEKFKGFEDTKGRIKTMKGLLSLSNEFAGMNEEDYATGGVQSFINNISKRASGEDWAKMGVKEKKALINQIGAKSKTGMLTSQILNQISGTAVSDQEFERIMGILTGGDIDTTNPRLIAEALRGSGETIGDMAKSDIQGIRSKYSPYDKMELAKLYKAGNIRPIGEKITGGDQTSMETAMKTIDKETQAASDLGVTAWDQLTGKADPIDPTARNESSAWNFLSNIGSDAKNYVSNMFSGGDDDKASSDPVNPSRAKYEAMDYEELKALIKSKSLSPDDRKLALVIAAGKYSKQRGI